MSLLTSLKLIVLLSITCGIYCNVHKPEGFNLWCRFCSAVVGDTSQILNVVSPGAMKIENRYMFGKNVTVQTLVNPFLFKFDVLTIENGSCDNVGPSIGGRTWFPGYAWRICTCPRCSAQLGWTFEMSNETQKESHIERKETFQVLILKHLLGLTEDDDPGVGILSFLKYSKPFKTSTLPSFVPRASNDTDYNQDKMTAIIEVVEQNKTASATENKTVTEAKNSTGSTTIVLATKIHNTSISENEIHNGNKTFTTKSK